MQEWRATSMLIVMRVEGVESEAGGWLLVRPVDNEIQIREQPMLPHARVRPAAMECS